MLEQNPNMPSALLQAFHETQKQQNSDPKQAMAVFQSLLQDKEIHEMLVRLWDK